MILKQCFAVNNDCYKKNEKINGLPKGIVVHSTAANNKNLKRYVQPVKSQSCYNDVIADLGINANHNDYNNPGKTSTPHAFIGVNLKNEVETYQILPYDICCWGCGSGAKGSYNYNPTARIQFEICEDNLTDKLYFDAVMKEAQEYCAYLCKQFNFGIDSISSHYGAKMEGYAGGNRLDIDHWLIGHNKDMNWFREEVQKILNKDNKIEYSVLVGKYPSKESALQTAKNLKVVFKDVSIISRELL